MFSCLGCEAHDLGLGARSGQAMDFDVLDETRDERRGGTFKNFADCSNLLDNALFRIACSVGRARSPEAILSSTVMWRNMA